MYQAECLRMIFFLNHVHYYDNDYIKDLADLLTHNF